MTNSTENRASKERQDNAQGRMDGFKGRDIPDDKATNLSYIKGWRDGKLERLAYSPQYN